MIKAAELNYYQNIFSCNSNSAKKIWAQINQLCSFKKSKNASVNITKLVINNNEIIEPVQIVEYLNTYFTHVGVNLSQNLPASKIPFTKYLNTTLTDSFYCDSINEIDILSEIKKT